MNGLYIKKRRKELGYSQKELAKIIGVSDNTIYNYEKGATIPQSKMAILRDILGEESQQNTGTKPETDYEKLNAVAKNEEINNLNSYINDVDKLILKIKQHKKSPETIHQLRELSVLKLNLLEDLSKFKKE